MTLEVFTGAHFDYALRLIGSGVPRLVLPVHSTKHLNGLLDAGWTRAKTVRLGWRKGRLFVECLLEKARPALKTAGEVVGMDSNYKHGLVFSDGQTTGDTAYDTIQGLRSGRNIRTPTSKSGGPGAEADRLYAHPRAVYRRLETRQSV